jgi:hypothetical protein
MAAKTLNRLVRDQILAEAPSYERESHKSLQDYYVNDQLRSMSNVELLERISDALQTLTERSDPRQWL